MNEKQQINLTLLHIGIGSLIALYPPLSKIYAFIFILAGIYFVVKSKNKNNEILFVIAYIAGNEVFFRTTHGNPIHEFGKYLMLFFTLLGFYYSGFPKIRNPYWLFLLLLLPSIFLSFLYLDIDWRKISFEILGPVCLGILALYTYKRKVTAKQVNSILTSIGLPILASCVYLILRFSQHAYSVNWSSSNYFFSGNYAPNQMATVLGLGVFIYLLKILTESGNKKIFYLNIIIFCIIFYRGLLTFSRGGIATGIIVILILLVSIFISREGYSKLKRKIAFSLVILTSIFILTAYQTENSLLKRYSTIEILNSDEKIKTRGRYIEIQTGIKSFIDDPMLGIGVGKAIEVRKNEYNSDILTHNEVTRMLSEHGALGLCGLLLLIFIPLQFYSGDVRNFYLLPFLIFWFLTINHSATRIIAPLFLYCLTLMHIDFEKDEDAPLIAKRERA